MKFSDHYTNPLVAWLLKKDTNENTPYKDMVYNLTGINLYRKLNIGSICGWVVLYYGFLIGIGLLALLLYKYTNIQIPARIGVVAPVVLIRMFWATTPNYKPRSKTYIQRVIDMEYSRFGKQVTPRWFIIFWYGVLRMGRWTPKYTLCVAFQFAIALLLMSSPVYQLFNTFPLVFAMYIASFGLYLHMVYHK